jgi:uncharacterized membrane protein
MVDTGDIALAGKVSLRQKLGFVRAWEAIFAFIVLGNLMALLFVSRSQVHLGFDDILVLGDTIFSGVAVWLIAHRKRATRLYICIYSAATSLTGVVGNLVINGGVWSLSTFIDHGRLLFVLAFVYFLFSQRVCEVLIAPFDTATAAEYRSAQKQLFGPRGSWFWRDAALYFMVFAVAGHLMERAYGIFARTFLGIYDPTAPMWQDMLSPFNIYGFGTVVCILALFPLKNWLAKRVRPIAGVLTLSFLVNTLVCAAIELAVGLIGNHPDATGHLPWWDYSNLPFNFMGQICLQNSIAFGLVATLMVWVIYPAIEKRVRQAANDAMNIVFIAVLVIYLILTNLYIINLSSLVQ